MTVKEYERHRSRLEWADWLRGILLKSLEGSGLRPQVDYVEAVWDYPSEKELKDNPDARPQLRSQEMYRLTITMPLEWRVINYLAGNDICVDRALEIVRDVAYFASEAWPDRMVSDYQYDIFAKLPGAFDFLTEKTPEILHRLTMWKVSEKIGVRNIRCIDLYDDLLVIKTRRGSWRIDYDDYRKRLPEVLKLMSPWMRKPIRGRYLYELRHGKQDKKDDKKQG